MPNSIVVFDLVTASVLYLFKVFTFADNFKRNAVEIVKDNKSFIKKRRPFFSLQETRKTILKTTFRALIRGPSELKKVDVIYIMSYTLHHCYSNVKLDT